MSYLSWHHFALPSGGVIASGAVGRWKTSTNGYAACLVATLRVAGERGLTIRPSRRRFAARLNSGVRAHWEFKVRKAILAILLAACTGCVSCPDTSEQAILASLRKAPIVVLCQSKIADLTAQLGEPSRDGLLGSARVVTWIVELDPLVRYLGVLVDDTDTVVDIYWNLPTEIPWVPANKCHGMSPNNSFKPTPLRGAA